MTTSNAALEKLMCIEALLIAILVQLPPKSIFRFKCVSKTWNNIFAEPFFLESYYKLRENRLGCQRFLAFINSEMASFATFEVSIKRHSFCNPSDTLPLTQNNYNFNQMVPSRLGKYRIRHPYNGLILCLPSVFQMVPSRFGRIRHSYNGLILCLLSVFRVKTFYIINPLTRMWVSLPPIDICTREPTGLTWEENVHNLIPIYKVVKAQEVPKEKNKVVIDTYCSKSGKWAKSKLIGREGFALNWLCAPIVSNGVFYWYTEGKALAVYNSNRDEKHMQLIKFPNDTQPDKSSLSRVTVSSHDDMLWYGKKFWKDYTIKFWILPKDKHQNGYKQAITVESNEWILMHTICISSFFHKNPNTKLHLLGIIPCNPVLAILSNEENIFLYNAESKRIELVSNCASSYIKPERSYALLPYVESLSLSSFALSTTYY